MIPLFIPKPLAIIVLAFYIHITKSVGGNPTIGKAEDIFADGSITQSFYLTFMQKGGVGVR